MAMGQGHSGSAGPPGGMVSASAAAAAAGSGTAPSRRERHGAVILDKSQKNAKRLARILASAGYSVKTFEDETPQSLWAAIASEPEMASWLLCGEAAAQSTICGVLGRLEARRHCRGIVYHGYASKDVSSGEELDIPTLCEQQGLVAVLGTRAAGGPSRDLEMELLGIACYLRGQPLLPLQAYMLWGATAYSTAIQNLSGRDSAEGRIVKLCSEQLNVGSRLTSAIGEVVHELLTNAMYDAPVDEKGRLLYAHDRTAPIQLSAEDRVTFRYCTDGLRLAVETVDRFGRLRRADLVRSLRRAASGQVNREAGGAGIGLSMIFRTAQALQFDVEPGAHTRVTAVFDLDPSRPAEGSRPARSLIFPDLTMASGRRDL